MTREEAIYHLNSTGWLEERERIAINFLDSIGCFEEHDRIMMPSADKPRGEWIPVSERLPDDGKWAIWCSSDGVIGIARFKEDCYNHFYPNETSFDLEDAVAWMPLPKPFCGVDMRGENK